MRRRAVAFSAFVLGLVLVLCSAPAYAAPVPLPPPVTPVETLPSTYSRVVATGSGQMFQDQIAFNLYVRQQMAAKAAAATATDAAAVAKAVPLTKAVPVGAAGGALTGGFMAGWMLTDGTLALYGHLTGSEPMEGTCSQPEWAQAAIGVLYPFSSPDCTVVFVAPNGDVVGGDPSLTFGAVTLTLRGSFTKSGTPYHCYQKPGNASGTVPISGSGYQLQAQNVSGGWAVVALGWHSSNCGGASGLGGGYDNGPTTTYTGQLRAVRTADGAITSMVTPVADPERTPSCQLTWPGGEVTTVEGDTYRESEGFPLEGVSALCNDGFVSKPGHGPDLLPSEIEIGSTREDTGDYSELQTEAVPEFTPDEKKGLTPGTSGGLVLQKVVGTMTHSCMTWDVDCAGWWTQTADGTTPATQTGTYRCLWNGSTVALAECGIYRNTFDTQTSTPTLTDPVTGEEFPWMAGTSPSTALTPGPTGGGACGAAWTWNPVDWVLNPLKCAFIPSTASVTALTTGLTDRWQSTAVGSVATTVTAWSFVAPSSSGCDGIAVPLSVLGHGIEDFQILNACAGQPLAPLALLSTLVISIGCVLTAIRAVTGSIGGIVGQRALAEGAS